MPSESGRLNDSGQAMHHLRRVGPPATRPGVVDIMDFKKVTSIIGRNSAVVDFYLDSSDNIQHHLLSRQHSRIVRIQNNQHKLFDDSLNGVFVNHVKICGTVILNEGDLVTFGHMAGQRIAVGIRVRQPDSEYQFIFERCNCPEPVDEPKTTKKFAVPRSPKGARKRQERNVTRTITPEELQNMKVKSSLIQAEQTCSNSDVAVPCPSSNLQSVTNQSAEVPQTNVSECAAKTSTEVSFTSGANSRCEKSESAVGDSSSVNSAMSTNLANDGEEPGSRSELKRPDNIAQHLLDIQSSLSNNDSLPARSEQISSDATDDISQNPCEGDVGESSVSVYGQISYVGKHQGDSAIDEGNSLVSSTRNNSELESDTTLAKVVRDHTEQTTEVADNHSTDGQNIVSFNGQYVSFGIKNSSEGRQHSVPGEIAEVRDSLGVEDMEIEPETVIEYTSESNKDNILMSVDIAIPRVDERKIEVERGKENIGESNKDDVLMAVGNIHVDGATSGVEDREIELETAIENISESNKDDVLEAIEEANVHDNVKLDENQDSDSLQVSENKHADLPSDKSKLDTGTTAVLGEVSMRGEECTLQKIQADEQNQLAVTDTHPELEMTIDRNVKPKEVAKLPNSKALRIEKLCLNDTSYVLVEEQNKIQNEVEYIDLRSERISEQEVDGSKEVSDATGTMINKEFDKAVGKSTLTHGDVGSISDSTSTAPADNSNHKECYVTTVGVLQHEESVSLQDNTDKGANAMGLTVVEILPVNYSASVNDQPATKTSDAKTNTDYFSSETLNAFKPQVTKDKLPEASEEPGVSTITAVCKEDQLLSCDRQQATDSDQEMNMDTEDDELLLAYDANEMETMSEEEKTEAVSVVQPSIVCPETEISQDSFTTIKEMETSTVDISENLDEEALGQCKLINADMNGPNLNAAVSVPEAHQASVIDIIREDHLPTANNKEQVMSGIEGNDKEQSVNTSCSLLDQETITEGTPGEEHTEIRKGDCAFNYEILKEEDSHGYSKGVWHKGSADNSVTEIRPGASDEHVVKSQHQVAKLSNVDGQTELNRSPSTSALMENESNSSCHEQKNATNTENSSTEVCSTVSGSSGVCDNTTVQDTTKTFDSSHCESDDVCDALSVNETRFFDTKELDSSALSGESLAEKSAENQNCLEKTMDNFSSSIDMDKIEKSEVSYAFQFMEVDKNLDETRSISTNEDHSTLDRTRCEEGVSDKVKEVNSCEHLNDLSLYDVVGGGIIATVGVDGVLKLEDDERGTEKVDKVSKQGKNLQCDGSEDKAKSTETECIDVLKKKNLNGDTFCKTVRSTFMLSDSIDFALQENIEENEESLENEVVIIERNQQKNADLSSGKEVAIEANHQKKNAESSSEDEVVVMKTSQQEEKVESSGSEVIVMETNQQEKIESTLDNDVVVMETNQQEEEEESSLESDVVVMETNQQEKKAESSSDNDIVVVETNRQEKKAESRSDKEVVVTETNQQEVKAESSSDNDVVVMETNRQEKKAESTSDNEVVVIKTNQQEVKAESPSDNDVVVMETNRQEEKAASTSDNEVVVIETNQQEMKAESSLDNEVVILETNRQEEKVKSMSDKEVVVIETNQQEVKAESSLDNEVVVIETNQQEEKAESTSDIEVVIVETNRQKDLEVQDVICLSEDYQYREEKPLDSESGTSQNSTAESSNSSIGLSQQFAELKQVMEMNQVIGACMDSILDRIESECNNKSEGSSVTTCGKTFTDADGLLAQLPKNTLIEIEVSMQSAKLLGLNPNLGEKETSQAPNQERSASNQDQYVELAQETKMVAEFEKIEHLEGEKHSASKADVEKEFTIEDLVKLQSELHSDVNQVCSENGHIDEVLTAKNCSEQDDTNEMKQNSGEIKCSDRTPQDDKKCIKDDNTCEAVQLDVCDSLSISTNKCETIVSSDATNLSGQLKSVKSDSQPEKFEIYIDNPETERTSDRDNLETKMSNSSVVNDKSETIAKVKEGDLVSSKTEEPECHFAEEIMDTGHLNADVVPPLAEKVVTVVLSDDEGDAVDDDDMLEMQTQQTDTADQDDPQHTDIIHDTSLHKIHPKNILTDKACNSTHVTRPRIMEPCFVQIYEQNDSQSEQQKLDSSYVGPRGCDHTLTVKDIGETSAVKTSSGSVHMERSISTDSENSGKVSLSNDLVYEWTVDPSKVAGSMESTNSLNTVSSSIDSMFHSTVESSAHVEQENVGHVDMMVISSEDLSGGKGTTYSDGHCTSGELEFKCETESESVTSIKEAKSKQVRKIEFGKESSVVQRASKSNIDVVNQKVDVHVDESDINSEENVSSLCRISECEEKSLMVGKKRKFYMEDDTTTTFVKKPCNGLDENRAQRCTRLRKIVRQYFSIKNFYGREKGRSSGQVKKELVAGLVHRFFRNMKTDLRCRKDVDSENDKSKQTTNLSDWKKQDLQKQEGDVGAKKDRLGKTMSNIFQSSRVHRNNVDINLSQIHPDSVTTSMDLGINHKNQGESFRETSKNVTDASNNIQSLHSESVEIFETNYREFRDTVEDGANLFCTMAGTSSKGNNIADVKEKETEFLKNACISRKHQEGDTSQGGNSGSKDTSMDSGHFKGLMDPDDSCSTENKNDRKSSLAGMLSQLQFDNLVQSIERESQSVILKEGNVTVVIGIPSASLSQSVLNTSEKSFCDVETQASSIDIDMETGVIDPSLISLPSSLEKDHTLSVEGSDSISDIVNKDMDKVHIEMNLNQNAQDSHSNHSSQSTKDSEFSAMLCTDDVSNNRMVDANLSHSTQKHSEDALFETSFSERSHPSQTSKDSCAKLSGKPVLEDVTFSCSLSVYDGSQNVPVESAGVNERRPSSECSHDSSRSTHSESLLGNIVLLYSNTVEGGRRASELTKEENRYLDVEKDKENDQVMTKKNSLEQRTLLLGPSGLKESLQEKGALNRNCEYSVPDSEEGTLNRNSECPFPDSSNDLVHSMSDSDDDGDREKVNTESSIEIISMSSSPEDSYVEFPSHRSYKSTCKSAKDLSSFEEEKEKYKINQGKKGKNLAGNLKRVTEDRKPYSPNSTATKDTINETETLQSISVGDEGRKGAEKVVGKNTSKTLRTKSRSLCHWSSDSTNPDADGAIGNSDSTVQSTNIDEKTEEDQTDCMMENSDKTFTNELDGEHTDGNSAVQSDSPESRVRSRYNLRNNSPYNGKKTKDESSDEAQNCDVLKGQVRKTKSKLYEEKYGWGHMEIDSDSDSDVGKGRRKSALSGVVKPVESTSSSDSSFDFSQRASQMKSKLPEFEDFQEGPACVVKQETFRRFSDFEDFVISDSSDSDLPEVEFLKYESPKKSLVKKVKCELLTPECKTEIRKSDFEEQGRTEKYPIQRVSKEALSKTKKRRKRSQRKCSEIVKEKKKMQSPRPKMTHLDSDSDVMIITGDSESDTYDVTCSKRRTPIKKEIIYSEDEDAEFASVKAVCSSQSGKIKDKGKQADPQNHKTRPKVRKEESRSGKNKLKRRRRKRTSGQSTCKQEGKNRRPNSSDESDSSDDLNQLYFHDVRESSARGGYSIEDIFNSESKQSLKEKGYRDDGNNDMEDDDNDIIKDNTKDRNQMKDDMSEEFSDQDECDDLVSETQTDHQDSNERHLGLLALDVMSPISPSPSQAMSPVIPSFIKAAHSACVDSSEAVSDSTTSHKEEACIDSDSTINYSDEQRNAEDVQDDRGEAPPGTNPSFLRHSNVSCNDEHTYPENPEIDINESDSEIADNQALGDSIECNSDRVKDTLDQSPHLVCNETPEEDDRQKCEESNTTSTKKVQDRVSASFDEEDDFVSPAIDFTALKSDDECAAENHSDGDSPVIPSTNIGSVETPKLGTSGAFNPDADDDFEPIPSTSFKKRKLFEMSESPAKKPCHEVVALDTEMSTQAVQEISNTQFDAAADQLTEGQGQSPSKMSKARMLIEKLKAKRLKKQEKEKSPEREPSSGSSQETPGEMPNAGQTRRQIMRTDVNTGSAEEHIKRCRDILQNLRTSFSSSSKLTANPRVVQWKKDLQELEDRAVLPQTIIAVVGDTGAGKSSLMNALLDQLDILPTSGMRACTAVVVEVIENTTNDKYEADITFLSKEEWYKELQLLLKDLTDSEGKIKKGTPDPKSEAGVAFLKIKAVYGRIDTYDVLSRIHLVTRWLDKTRTISNSNPESFRNVINRYIETDDPGAGGQFWPIVKQVRIRLPNCDVCSSGAVLVDLPGVRDSNAARDKIARDYLKKCTVVWVVSSIHRAIDDKTAKDLLGENFRRQLLMDGQYGSIAFICTKADIIKPTEIIRGLKLQKDIESFEKKLEELELEQCKLEESVRDNKKCLRSMYKEGRQLQKELEEVQEVMAEGDIMDLESQEFNELQQEKEQKEKAVKENEETIEKYEKETKEAESRCLQIDMDKSKIRKQLSAFCAMKRNEYSKLQIKKDFKAGLREMKRRADMNHSDFDEEDDDDLYNSDDDDEEIGSSADNLKVFCVSATEYQKMKNLLTNDGPPAVFSSEDETQIPALQEYVHQLTSVRRKHGVERLLQRLAQYVFDINHYLVEDGTESKSARRNMKNTIKLHSSGLMEKFDPVMQKLMSDLKDAFCGQINPKMYEGVAAANNAANTIVAKWGSKQNKENRSEGGLHFSTYRATIRRQGVFTSPSFGPVNFNEDLSSPMYTCLSIVWDKVFSGILWNHLERCKIMLINTLKRFVDELCKELLALGVPDTRTSRVTQQILDSSTHKLSEMISFLKEYVTEQQREINRILTPIVQENLSQTYEKCTMESGIGMFMRIKEKMSQGVDCSRFIMFDEASRQLLTDLEELQKHIISYVRKVCEEICGMVQTSFEPLYEAPESTKLLRKALLKDMEASSCSVRQLLTQANVTLPALTLPTATADTGATTGCASSTSGPVAIPGKGPHAYTTAYQGVQHIVTDTLGFPQNITLEEVKSTYVTDILKNIKEEPGSPSSITPVRAVHIKKEWNATDCGQGSVNETVHSTSYHQDQFSHLGPNLTTRPFMAGQQKLPSTSSVPSGISVMRHTNVQHQPMKSILPQGITNTAKMTQPSSSYTAITQPHMSILPRGTRPVVSSKVGGNVVVQVPGSHNSALPSGGMRVVAPSTSQISGNRDNAAYIVTNCGTIEHSNGHPVIVNVPPVAQTVEVRSSSPQQVMSGATGMALLGATGLAKKNGDGSALRNKVVKNAKNLKVPPSLKSPEKHLMSHGKASCSFSSSTSKGNDSPSLKLSKSSRLSLSQKRPSSPVQTLCNVTVKSEPADDCEPVCKRQRRVKYKGIVDLTVSSDED